MRPDLVDVRRRARVSLERKRFWWWEGRGRGCRSWFDGDGGWCCEREARHWRHMVRARGRARVGVVSDMMRRREMDRGEWPLQSCRRVI